MPLAFDVNYKPTALGAMGFELLRYKMNLVFTDA